MNTWLKTLLRLLIWIAFVNVVGLIIMLFSDDPDKWMILLGANIGAVMSIPTMKWKD